MSLRSGRKSHVIPLLADDIGLLGCVGNHSHGVCLCSLHSAKTKGKNEIRISAAKISEYLGIFIKRFSRQRRWNTFETS